MDIAAIPVPQSERDKQRQVQRMMALLSASSLEDDGIIGRLSRAKYAALAPAARAHVNEFIRISGAQNHLDISATTPDRVDEAPFRDIVLDACAQTGVDPNYALRIMMKESRGNPNARSISGARGLFQLTDIAVEDVYQKYASQPRVPRSKQYDPVWNIWAGVRYIRICGSYAGYSAADLLSIDENEGTKIYAVYNLGIGSYRDLIAGDHGSARLMGALSTQAAALQVGGPSSYLSNVRSFLYG